MGTAPSSCLTWPSWVQSTPRSNTTVNCKLSLNHTRTLFHRQRRRRPYPTLRRSRQPVNRPRQPEASGKDRQPPPSSSLLRHSTRQARFTVPVQPPRQRRRARPALSNLSYPRPVRRMTDSPSPVSRLAQNQARASPLLPRRRAMNRGLNDRAKREKHRRRNEEWHSTKWRTSEGMPPRLSPI